MQLIFLIKLSENPIAGEIWFALRPINKLKVSTLQTGCFGENGCTRELRPPIIREIDHRLINDGKCFIPVFLLCKVRNQALSMDQLGWFTGNAPT